MLFDWERLRTDAKYRAVLTEQVQQDDARREVGREICKTNLLALLYVLGYTKIDPEVHREALDFFLPRDLSKPIDEQGAGRLSQGILLYPRGTYKTTIDEGDTVQEVICFPLVAVVFIMCATAKLAEALVKNVALHFIKPFGALPTLFQALFPELCVSDRRAGDDGMFTAGQRQEHPPIKEPHVMALSGAAGVSGWHCWRKKGDDLANNRNMKTENSRDSVAKDIALNRGLLNPGGIDDMLGTRYHPQDPYGRELAKRRPGSFRYVIKPALRLMDGRRIDANGFPEEHEVELLFAKIGLTYEFLRNEYDNDFEAFMLNYMNDSAGANEIVFDAEQVARQTRPEEEMPVSGKPWIHWRLPSKGPGFNFAAAAVGLLQGARMYIVDGVYGVYRPSNLAVKIVRLAKKHGVTQVNIEETPGFENFAPAIYNFAATLGWPINITWTPYEDAAQRESRIKSFEPILTAGRVVFSRELAIAKHINGQFTTFGMTDETGIADVVSRVCGHLPALIFSESSDDRNSDDDLAWEMMKQRDMYNHLHGVGEYAPPEPEEAAVEEVDFGEHYQPNSFGLEEIMPGLES